MYVVYFDGRPVIVRSSQRKDGRPAIVRSILKEGKTLELLLWTINSTTRRIHISGNIRYVNAAVRHKKRKQKVPQKRNTKSPTKTEHVFNVINGVCLV